MADIDDVPPLEDMSELIQKVKVLKSVKQHHSTQQISPKDVDKATHTAPLITQECTQHSKKTKTASSSSSNFGGFKKGFLFGSSTKTDKLDVGAKNTLQTNAKNTEDIPFIKPTQADNKERQFEMPEVQKAMSAGEELLQNKGWVTEDLLKKITSNPTLSKRLMDPVFMQAIEEFQTNPQAAMAKYQQNMEIQMFLKDFCGIMGDHFSQLGDVGISSKATTPITAVPPESRADIAVHSSTDPKQPTAEDEQRMKQILADPEIRDILQDPRIQRLFEVLRTDPQKAQRVLQSTDVNVQKMIRKLCDVGLLQFQR